MSRHNQQRSAEEGINVDASAIHLIHKWLNVSRQSPSFMLGELG
jgi:hypothetical protein